MAQNPQIISKKARNLLHIIFFTLKKTISKTRFFNFSDINMIMTRGKIKIAGKSIKHLRFPTPPPTDDEFSCTTTPQHPYDIDEILIDPAVIKAVEMLKYGKSPVVRQLRITDSPFPLSNGDDDGQVDEDAERFILRFYNGLKREN